jgi:hypothetical protein
MATVAELTPGDVVSSAGMSALFVARGPHPIWPSLMLVTWRLRDAFGYLGWSHDALAAHQHVGEVEPSTAQQRQARLREVLTGEDGTS